MAMRMVAMSLLVCAAAPAMAGAGAVSSAASTDMVTTLVEAWRVLVDRSVNVGPVGASVGGGVASGVEAEDSTDADAEAEAETDALLEADTESLPLAEIEPDAEADPEAETDAEAEAEAEPEADPLAEGSAEADSLSLDGRGAAPMGAIGGGTPSPNRPWGDRFLMMRFSDACPPRRSRGVCASTAVATRRSVRKVKSVVVLCDKASIVVVLSWC